MQYSAGNIWILGSVWTLFTGTTHLNIVANQMLTPKAMAAPDSRDHQQQSNMSHRNTKTSQEWFEVLNKKARSMTPHQVTKFYLLLLILSIEHLRDALEKPKPQRSLSTVHRIQKLHCQCLSAKCHKRTFVAILTTRIHSDA